MTTQSVLRKRFVLAAVLVALAAVAAVQLALRPWYAHNYACEAPAHYIVHPAQRRLDFEFQDGPWQCTLSARWRAGEAAVITLVGLAGAVVILRGGPRRTEKPE